MQLWVQRPPPIVGIKSQFSLVNVNYGSKDDPLRAMQISDDGSYPVHIYIHSSITWHHIIYTCLDCLSLPKMNPQINTYCFNLLHGTRSS